MNFMQIILLFTFKLINLKFLCDRHIVCIITNVNITCFTLDLCTLLFFLLFGYSILILFFLFDSFVFLFLSISAESPKTYVKELFCYAFMNVIQGLFSTFLFFIYFKYPYWNRLNNLEKRTNHLKHTAF